MAQSAHIPVLLGEAVAALAPRPGQTLLDCTAGLGGHAAAVARTLGPGGRVVLMDLDAGNLARAAAAVRQALGTDDPAAVVTVHGSFAWAAGGLAERGIAADMLLADLGFASSQMDDPARGLSIRRPGPLDMRLDPSAPLTAARLVAESSAEELADILYRFGEERLSRRIAAAVVAARARSPITTTDALADIVYGAYPPKARHGRIHPATRTFQALRIAVNDEIGALEALLASIERRARKPGGPPAWLAEGARVAIISFHSLEDRPVKQCFRRLVDENFAHFINKKPIVSTDAEIARNARARSAKLRALALTGDA